MDEIKEFEVWLEGYAATGERGTAQYLGKQKATSFKEACIQALIDKDWDLSIYDENTNSYWACKFYDNEEEARKSFG